VAKKLLILNGLAILMIPLQHATAYGLQALFEWTNRYLPVEVPNYDLMGSVPYHAFIIIRQISSFSVPAFLFISGYFIAFLAKGMAAKLNWSQVLPRVKGLIYPFIIWTVLRYVLLRQMPTSIDDLLNPYHFIPLLIQFYLIAPLLVWAAKGNWKLLLLIVAVFHFAVQALRYIDGLGLGSPGLESVLGLTPRWILIGQQPFWFPLGIVFGLYSKEATIRLEGARWKLFAAALIFLLLTIAEYYVGDYINGSAWIGPTNESLFRNFYILTIILFILSLDESQFIFPKRLSELGARSLGIYMANIPAIFVVAVFMYTLTPRLLGHQFIYMIILFIAGLFGPLMLMWTVRNTPARRYYRYLFG
jgi:surface polysaccharide O-acyltransferase-like enzyme